MASGSCYLLVGGLEADGLLFLSFHLAGKQWGRDNPARGKERKNGEAHVQLKDTAIHHPSHRPKGPSQCCTLSSLGIVMDSMDGMDGF